MKDSDLVIFGAIIKDTRETKYNLNYFKIYKIYNDLIFTWKMKKENFV